VVIKVSLTMVTLRDDFTINFKRQGFNAKIRRYQDVIKNKRQSQTITITNVESKDEHH
jgi:hypothetical protein